MPIETIDAAGDGIPRRLAGRARALPGLLAKAPWWLSFAVGAACTALGLALATRPLSSLGALAFYVGASFILSGVAGLLGTDARSTPTPSRNVIGAAWIVAGLAVLVWVGGAISVLPLFMSIALIATGVLRGASVFRGSTDERTATAIFALADILLGVLALAWPDMTLLVLAVLFGARTLFFGVGQMFNAVVVARRGRKRAAKTGRRTGFRRWLRVTGAVLALVVAVSAAGLGRALNSGSPQLSAFYDAPADVPAHPGALLKSEPFTTAVPSGAKAWRILYTTTAGDGTAALASAVVLTSLKPASSPRPVITWAHGTTGYMPNCAPSNLSEPFSSGALPALDQIVDNGWVLVATDYAGLGTTGPQPYLIGQGEARSVLDAVRAAKALSAADHTLSMADSTVVWGHSQGGQAALWTGGLASNYAPDVKISGVAAMAPASDAIGLVKNLPNVTGGSVFASYVAAAYSDSYPEVKFNDYIAGPARTFVREMSTRCLSEPGVLVSIINAIVIDKDRTIFAKDPTSGAMGERLRENTPTLPIPYPLFVAQGLTDPLVVPSVQSAYVAQRCAAGQKLQYKTYAGKDHMGLVGSDSPFIRDLIAWTKDRIAGLPAASNCGQLP
jgi:uncharacterized membrane protein HdeD (DUF308 family)/alpha-beta hydrolase superfamily lysophospholipase